MFDLTEVGFVKRITIGSLNAEELPSEEKAREVTELLNRCLSDTPRGRVIGIEKNFQVLNIGEHQVVLQNLVYHVAFPRKPYWLD